MWAHPQLWGIDRHLEMARILVLSEGSSRETLVRGPSAPEVEGILAGAGVTVDRAECISFQVAGEGPLCQTRAH